MGVIKKQAIRGTVITYLAVIVGFVTTAILMPKLETEVVGLVNILVTYATVIALLAGLGFGGVTVRLFAYFRDKENKHNGFMFIAVATTIVGFILALLFILILAPIIAHNRTADNLFVQYFYYLIPMVFFLMWYNTLDAYFRVLFKSVRGIVLKELVQKLSALIAVALLVYHIVNLDAFVFLYCLGFCLPGIVMLLLSITEGEMILKPQFNFIDKELRKSMVSVGFFGIISGASGVIAITVDRMMIESLHGLSETGIYSIAFYFGALISIPSRSLLKIASPIIAESWKNNDPENIKSVYKKSSLTQFIVGVLLFVGIVINKDNIVQILSDKYASGQWVILLIAFAFLTDMAVGAASQVIGNSNKYKLNTYLLLGYVGMVVITNFLLIPGYGINGAAMATLLSKIIYNVARVIVVKVYFNMQPFNYRFGLVIFLALVAFGINYILPVFNNLFVDILIRSGVVTVVYLLAVLALNISEDISQFAKQIMQLLKR